MNFNPTTYSQNKKEIKPQGGQIMISGFLQGVVSDQYEVKLIQKYTVDGGIEKAYVITRTWSANEVLKNISFLQLKNSERFNVYIRPMDPRFILLDDLSREVLNELAAIKPCLLMETSPDNFQAWVKLSQVPDDRNELSKLWKALAAQFRADHASAKPDQIGRLPGFFNIKSKYSPNFPMVILHKYSNRQSTWKYDFSAIPPVVNSTIHSVTRKPGTDRSAFDFAKACELVEKGWPDEKIKQYLKEKSNKVKERGDSYAITTISKARKKTGK
jgi:hypothetical protein